MKVQLVTTRLKGEQMLALLAAIVFAVGLFGGHIGSIDLLYLGLFLLTLHHVFGGWVDARLWRRS